MFTEFFSARPLEGLLSSAPYRPFPPAGDREAWDALPGALAAGARACAEQFRSRPYPMRTASAFLAFTRTGSRTADEEPYFFRRRRLCAAVLACCLDHPARPEDLADVADGIWCICEETSWVISAHNVNAIPGAPAPADYPLPDPDKPYIDLFSAQTGMILSLTLSLLGGPLRELTPMLEDRVRRELRLRILDPFMATDDFWWMGVRRTDLCNWTPWILSNVMLCACLSPLERPALAALLERACAMLDRWLACVPADGGCDEGAGYWNMAGGALLDCLGLLEDVTDGRLTFWDDPKVRNILTFPLRAEIGGGWFINFADCDARPFLSGERIRFAGEKLKDPALTAMGIRLSGSPADQLSDVPHFSRLLSLLFHRPAGVPADPAASRAPEDVWLPDLQVRIVRRGRLILACKGGHNGESHNHNDVGSFMLYADGEPVILDTGNRIYTAKTFSAERYTLWNVRSAFHNLPLIGGQEQLSGREHAAREVACLPDGLALDLAPAYGAEAGLERLSRTLALTENGFTLTDSILLRRPAPVTWVWMLRSRPVLSPGRFTCGPLTAAFDPCLEASLEEIPVTDPRMARSFPGSLWRLSLTAPAGDLCEDRGRFTVTAAP